MIEPYAEILGAELLPPELLERLGVPLRPLGIVAPDPQGDAEDLVLVVLIPLALELGKRQSAAAEAS